MTTMLETIGVVQKEADNPAEKRLTPTVKEKFLLATRDKLTESSPTCLGFDQNCTNPFASENFANSFYDPGNQTFLQNSLSFFS